MSTGSTGQRFGDRAAEIAAALAAAQTKIGCPRPEMVSVADWELLALPCGEEVCYAADRMVTDAGTFTEPGRGHAHWHARPDLIKFAFTDDLAAAYRATGDPAYAGAFRRLLEDYFLSLKPPNWAGGGMRLSQRIGRWARFLPYFLDADAFDEAFIRKVLAHIPEQLQSILRTHQIRSRGNIRLLETEGLFWVGLALPMLEGADEALERARWVYTDTARRGVYADGSYCEYDPNYHGVFQATFYNLMIWREAFPALNLPDVRDAAVRVFDYAAVTRSPTGHACGMQESPSPWISDTDCSAILRKRAEVRRLAGLDGASPALVHACLDASQVFMRTGWDRDAMFAGFDASRWGGAHSHLARNSVLFYSFGRALLADTGSLTYAMDQKAHEGDALDHRIGPYGKSTRAHNTLNLNGWNQATTNPDTLRVLSNEQLTAVHSCYSGGYWPGSYGWWFREGYGAGIHAEHQRTLLWVPGRFIVTVDLMMRWDESVHGHAEQKQPSLEMNWQLSPGGDIELRGDSFIARYPEGNLLGHFAKLAAGMTLSIHEGETEPPRGWVTTRTKARGTLRRLGVFDDPKLAGWQNRTYIPAPQLCGLADPMQGFSEGIVSVFVPFENDAPAIRTHLSGEIASDTPQGTDGQLTIEWGDGSTDLLAWSHELAQPLIEVGEARTDGSVLHLHHDAAGQLLGGSALDASYAKPDVETPSTYSHY